MAKIIITILAICVAVAVFSGRLFAFKDNAFKNAEEKAKEIHDLASSDVIQQDVEIRALYYQNIQIIEILKEIRDLLAEQKEKKGE